ncbi:hypothetical protein [Paraburkholderia terrae]|uniref:hypothetical protein n=1 Tax=Paraburkholderia terrae TaxID=311230 RepID=UPI0033659190
MFKIPHEILVGPQRRITLRDVFCGRLDVKNPCDHYLSVGQIHPQAGGQFGIKILWSMPAAFPLMAAANLMCARV